MQMQERRQQAAQGVSEFGTGMDFNESMPLDPSQVEFMPGYDDVQGLRGLGGQVAGGGGGGGDWGYVPPVEDVEGFGGFGGGIGGLIGMLGGTVGAPVGVGAAGGAPRASGGGGGFTARPPGQDFGGYDITPDNLISRQGLTGVPRAVRTLLAAERRLGVPELSENVSGEGYRSTALQSSLYQDYLAGRHPAVVAPPGQSYHEQGEAFDIGSGWLSENPQVRPWLERHGFTFDVPGEPWHAHYEGGGQPLRKATGNRGRPITVESNKRGAPSRTPMVNRPTAYR